MQDFNFCNNMRGFYIKTRKKNFLAVYIIKIIFLWGYFNENRFNKTLSAFG